MAKMFCLACYYCDMTRRPWVLGWCLKKEFVIKNPFKNCRVGEVSTHSIREKGMNLLEWIEDIQENNTNRRLAIMKWRSIMDWEKGAFK